MFWMYEAFAVNECQSTMKRFITHVTVQRQTIHLIQLLSCLGATDITLLLFHLILSDMDCAIFFVGLRVIAIEHELVIHTEISCIFIIDKCFHLNVPMK